MCDQKSDIMNDLMLTVFYYNSVFAAEPWLLIPNIYVQRFYYIKGGDGWYFDKNGVKQPFLKGKIYIMPYYMECCFQQDPQNRCDHVYIDFITAPVIHADQPLVYDVKENSEIWDLIQLFETINHRLIRYDNHSAPDLLRNVYKEEKRMVTSILKILLTLCDHERKIPYASDPSILRTVQHIHSHYHEPITNEELAKIACLSKNYFIERFSCVMGMTPYAYLKQYRLFRAKAFLMQGYSLSYTAEKVGYENASSLSRALKIFEHRS